MSDRHDDKKGTSEARFGEQVGRKAARKLSARRAEQRSIWFWLGMFGLVGWSVAVPTLVGIIIGSWIDRTWPGPPSWTLNLLIVGLIIGCINAWRWVVRESQRKD